MTLTLPEILALLGIFMLAGTVKGVIGLGLPTVSMGLLSLLMSPAYRLRRCAGAVVGDQLLAVVHRAGRPCTLRRLWPMMVCVAMGAMLTTGAP